ncbi:hypothetical protein Patl1_00584 [Pistacia atlantica]|uniref:Uncharacterized protein n=1 Tax=Pistacia atlantica TaxID=434234 RepID=A0ACC1CAY0_9ROSI|nr:hypothetical protein Patl1_00584 [Pistacia atlantica]
MPRGLQLQDIFGMRRNNVSLIGEGSSRKGSPAWNFKQLVVYSPSKASTLPFPVRQCSCCHQIMAGLGAFEEGANKLCLAYKDWLHCLTGSDVKTTSFGGHKESRIQDKPYPQKSGKKKKIWFRRKCRGDTKSELSNIFYLTAISSPSYPPKDLHGQIISDSTPPPLQF